MTHPAMRAAHVLVTVALATMPRPGAGVLVAQNTSPLASPTPTLIVVSGRAESTVPADHATLTVAVETHAATAAEAGSENARLLQRVTAALRRAGVDAGQLTTMGYNVAPEYRYDQGSRSPIPTGYMARNAVRLELTNLDQIGQLIDVSLGAGANRVEGLQFSATSTVEARRHALTDAVANARTDALTLARASGGSLGPLLEVSTERYEGAPRVEVQYDVAVRSATSGLSPTSIDARTIRVTAVVLTRWLMQIAP